MAAKHGHPPLMGANFMSWKWPGSPFGTMAPTPRGSCSGASLTKSAEFWNRVARSTSEILNGHKANVSRIDGAPSFVSPSEQKSPAG
jgi:hypothetical protein